MMKKVSLPILITLFCVVAAAALGLAYLSRNKIKETDLADKKEKIIRTDYGEVAAKTLDWMESQRNDNGWYILERGCDFETKSCDTVWDNTLGNKDGLVATWARFNFYEQTKNPTDLEIVKSDIGKFSKSYSDDLESTLWTCKVAYDMWNSGVFDEETKNELDDICMNIVLPDLIVDYKEYMENRSKIVSGLKDSKTAWKSWLGYATVVRGVDSYFGTASDLVSQYRWSGDESKLDLAKKYFESGKKIIEEMDNLVMANDDCLLGISAIDLYEYGGKDEDFLNYAKSRYLTFSAEGSDVKKYRTAICGLMTKKLYQITGNELFLEGLEKNSKVMTGVLLDGDDSAANQTRSYGFFVTGYGGFRFPYKNVVENGLVVELLRD